MGRRDATKLKDIDSMHVIMPLIYPNRCDNEAFMMETLDLTKLNEYLETKKGQDPDYKYNMFQFMVAAILKTIILRPNLNYFIANKTMWNRNFVSAAFTVKKEFKDDGGENMAVIKVTKEDTIDTIHEKVKKHVKACKDVNQNDPTTDIMDVLKKLPSPILRLVGDVVCFLEKRGKAPAGLLETDPYQNSVVIANIGSLGSSVGLHHLTNFGTTSLFLLIGQMKKRPFWDEEGNMTMKPSVEVSFTIDERIADGYYYTKSIRLFKKLVEECPELLEKSLDTVPEGWT